MTRLAAAALVLFVSAATAHAIEGAWLATPDEALAQAAKAQKPVLAVAMDHA